MEKKLLDNKGSLRAPDLFWLAVRLAIGSIFAYAGFMKLIEPVENFEAAISDYNLFPPSIIPAIARTVPWIELIGGTFLFLGYLPQHSAAVIGSLSLSFAIILAISILGGEGAESCGCFGESGIKLTSNQMFVLDTLACAGSLKLFARKAFPLSLHTRLTRS